ncbi:endocytosis [Sarracenia purpurea var. burkii]
MYFAENSSNEKCPISLFSTPKGAQCFCDPNNKQLDELCQEVEDCSFEYRCSQRCSRYRSKISCSCYDSYYEVRGSKGIWCESNVSQADTLLYSTSSKIKALNTISLKTSVLVNQVECASLTAAHNYLYFTTYRDYRRAIHASAVGSQISAPLIEWIEYAEKLKCCEIDLIALAPKSGLMFYTSKTSRDDDRFIMKSNMDGSNEVILVDSSFQNPTALTVDELAEKLYWIDRNKLYLASFNGFFKQLALDSFVSYDSEVSLAVSQKNVYVVEKRNNYINTITYRKTTAIKFYQDVYTTSIESLFLYNALQQDIYKVTK